MKRKRTSALRRILGSVVLALILMFVGGCRRQRSASATIPRSQWPFRELEVHEAASAPFPGSTPEHDEYGSFYVETRPFLGTDQIDRLDCVEGTVFVILRDHAAADFEWRTSQLFTNGGRLALYVDGKLSSAPLVAARVVGGRFQLPQTVCK